MSWKGILTTLAAIALSGNLIAAETMAADPAKGQASLLKEGTYTAKVAALACSACPPQVEKVLSGVKGVSAVSVDAKTKMVRFTVGKGATVSEADIQKALKAAAAEMGMGADYTLHDITPGKT